MRVIDFGDERCKKVADLLDAFLNNGLSPETSQRIGEHVDSCERCAGEARQRTELQRRVKKALGSKAANEAVKARLRARLQKEDSSRSFWSLSIPLAAAAALLMGFFAAWNTLHRPQEPWQTSAKDQRTYIEALYTQVSSVVRVGLGDHAHCAHFRKFAESLPTMEEILSLLGSDYEELAPIVREETPPDFKILLGHQCKYDGRQYVHFALGRDDELLSVIITRRREGESFERDELVPVLQAAGTPIYGARADAFEIAGFDTEHYLAFVISNLPQEENLQIAEALTPRLRAFLEGSPG